MTAPQDSVRSKYLSVFFQFKKTFKEDNVIEFKEIELVLVKFWRLNLLLITHVGMQISKFDFGNE